MTIGELVARLQSAYGSTVTLDHDAAGRVCEVSRDLGYRNRLWAVVSPPLAEGETIADEVARALCRELQVPLDSVGL